MTVLIIVSLVILLMSALSSMTEAAYLSLNELDVQKMLQDQECKTARLVDGLIKNLSQTISVIVILNNIANITGSMAVGTLAAGELDSTWKGIFNGAFTFAIILWAEIIPKTLGERYDAQIARVMARPLWLLTAVVKPVVKILNALASLFVPGKVEGLSTTDESEIKLLAGIGEKEGVINKGEKEMIEKVFQLNDLSAADVMTPRVKMFSFKGNQKIGNLREEIIASPYSRIIIIGESTDDIKGVVFKNDLLAALVEDRFDAEFSEFLREVRYVPEQAKCDRLLADFRKERRHLAVVVDEFTGVSGVVTLEDVLEVITGEIVDESDQVADLQLQARLQKTLRL